jgi:hypothetical protein
MSEDDEVEIPVSSEAKPPTLYDGLTAEQCLEVYALNQRYEGVFGVVLRPLQLAAARDLWSQQLRARVTASAAARLAIARGSTR